MNFHPVPRILSTPSEDTTFHETFSPASLVGRSKRRCQILTSSQTLLPSLISSAHLS